MTEEHINIEKEYKKIKSKHPDLPTFDRINKEFELFYIKEKEGLLFSIGRRIGEYIGYFAGLIEHVYFPNPSNLVGAFESKNFDEEDKIKLTKMHKRIMLISRELVILQMKKDENAMAKYIGKLMKEWEEIKKNVIWVTGKMRDSWENEEQEKKNNYFG